MKDKVMGYTQLTQSQIQTMNEIKGHAEEIGRLVSKLDRNVEIDTRWLAIGKQDLQKGFMALNRSVAKPATFG